MTRLEIPDEFSRVDPIVQQAGVEKTGAVLIQLACERMGLPDLSGMAILDIGCGTRFAQTIINRGIPIGSYTGIDVDRDVIRYLSRHVKDDRFSFHRWRVYNHLYNPRGKRLAKITELPLATPRQFDVIWLFSVFTHLNPEDARNMLRILRGYIADTGHLFFTAFMDHGISDFEDRDIWTPLRKAYYGDDLMKQMLSNAGWTIRSMHPADLSKWIQDHFVCVPAPLATPRPARGS
jgi:SAM-dependent methyltransferase